MSRLTYYLAPIDICNDSLTGVDKTVMSAPGGRAFSFDLLTGKVDYDHLLPKHSHDGKTVKVLVSPTCDWRMNVQIPTGRSTQSSSFADGISILPDKANTTTPSASERKYQSAVRSLDRILDDDLDYEPPSEAVNTAKQLLSYCIKQEWDAPSIEAQGDEAVVLVWSANGRYRFVTVTDGEIALLAEDAGHTTYKKDSIPFARVEDFAQIECAFGRPARRTMAKRSNI
jgi:hypothetical protein